MEKLLSTGRSSANTKQTGKQQHYVLFGLGISTSLSLLFVFIVIFAW
jgi:hypothetical protein